MPRLQFTIKNLMFAMVWISLACAVWTFGGLAAPIASALALIAAATVLLDPDTNRL